VSPETTQSITRNDIILLASTSFTTGLFAMALAGALGRGEALAWLHAAAAAINAVAAVIVARKLLRNIAAAR
jgi:hypothetical protein